MATNVLDKVRKFKTTRPQQSGNRHMRGIFHNWKDGDNTLRLAGEFIEVRTHFIAPAPKRSERGVCRMDAFQGDDKLPQVTNCPDWDIDREEMRRTKTCPVCKLRAIALAVLHENPTAEEKAYFEALLPTLAARRNVKWNIIDRDDPYVTVLDNGAEQKVLGFKIATIGMEAYNDIEGIFEQCGFDITDPEQGIDIKVVKGFNGTRTTYTAQACVEGINLKVTPFTEEEQAMVMHDLKTVCGRQTDIQKIIDAMHEDLRQYLEVQLDDSADLTDEAVAAEVQVEEPAEEVSTQPAAPAKPVVKPPVVVKPAVPIRPAATSVAKPVPAATKPTVPAARPVAPVMSKPAAPAARPAVPARSAPAARPAVPARPAPAARPAVPARPAPLARPAPRPVARPATETAAIDEAVGEAGGDGLMDDVGSKKE